MKLKLLPLTLIFACSCTIQAQQILDNSFGTNGLSTVNYAAEYITSCVVKTDGKILLSGYAGNGPDDTDFTFAQFNADGSPDLTFGTDGFTTYDYGNVKNHSYASVLQSDGKLITVGRSYSNPDNPNRYCIIVMRTNTDGSIDTTFGNQGAVIQIFSAGSVMATSVTLDSNDNIYIGCKFEYISSIVLRYGAVAKINSSGTAFQYLYVLPSLNSQDQSEVSKVAVQTDGKILFTGYRKAVGQTDEDMVLGRLNTDGTLDENFGTAGLVYLEADANTDTRDKAFSLHLTNDEKIVISGVSTLPDQGNQQVILIGRFNSDGTPDQSFGESGKTIVPFAADSVPVNSTSILQPDGKIVIGGQNNSSNNDFAFARCNADGSLDGTFGTDGFAAIEMEGNEKITAMGWQSGKVIACGTHQTDTGEGNSLLLMRLLENNLGVSAYENHKISISPNPASQRIHLNTDAVNQNYTITDINGRTIAKGVIGAGGINIESLTQGIYILGIDFYGAIRFIKK